ncbi:MAG: hypothetical protein V7727_18495 [Sneathiella sp.]
MKVKIMELQELITLGVPLPVGAVLYWLHLRLVSAEAKAAEAIKDLAEYKLEVAKEYASIKYLKDVENRLIDVLNRIDDRLNNLGGRVTK